MSKNIKTEENSVKVTDKLYLSCLCGKHSPNSDCEVYLRNQGKWTSKMEEGRFLKMISWLKQNEPEIYDQMYPTTIGHAIY